MSGPQQIVTCGSMATAGLSLAGFLVSAIPILQALSLLIGCLVGVLTAVYTYRRIKARKY